MGREAEADTRIACFERVAGVQPEQDLPPVPAAIVPHAAGELFRRPVLGNLIVGCVSLMAANTLIFGFVSWLPTFFIGQGNSISRSTGFAAVMALGGPIGSALGALAADYLGCKLTIVAVSCIAIILSGAFVYFGASPVLPIIGFLLTIPIYILVAVLFAIYIPELFPTALRLRGVGIANALGRSASIIVPLLIGPLFAEFGIPGVLAAMSAALLVMCFVVMALGTETGIPRLSRSGKATT
jgi:MFS transporter, putative metabolite:H+ symporter